METIRSILGFVSLILLLLYWNRRNAVWGGFTIGIIAGFVAAVFSSLDWLNIGKWAVSGTLVGFAAEMLGELSDYYKRKMG